MQSRTLVITLLIPLVTAGCLDSTDPPEAPAEEESQEERIERFDLTLQAETWNGCIRPPGLCLSHNGKDPARFTDPHARLTRLEGEARWGDGDTLSLQEREVRITCQTADGCAHLTAPIVFEGDSPLAIELDIPVLAGETLEIRFLVASTPEAPVYTRTDMGEEIRFTGEAHYHAES